jgi:glutamate dehydrogenase (NAD(P)+)
MSRSENLYSLVQDQYNQSLVYTDISEETKAILSQPMNEIIVNFPVRLSDGNIKMFKGYRV